MTVQDGPPPELQYFTLLDPGYVAGMIANPWPVYAALLQHAPILQSVDSFYYLSTYSLVKTVLEDRRFVKRGFNVWYREQLGADSPIYQVIGSWLFLLDPPDHLRLRKLVQQAFSRERVEGLRGTIQQLTDALLDDLSGARRMDAIQDFALPLPLQVICALLSIPRDDRMAIQRWTDTLVPVFDPAFLHQVRAQAEVAMQEFVSYARELIDERRGRPGNDLVSDLIQVHLEGGDRLDEEELVSMVLLLIMAGYETTKDLLGQSILVFLIHPESRSALIADPGSTAGAIEECLRFITPTQLFQAQASEPIQLYPFDGEAGSVTLPAGALVNGLLAAANRDPRQFPAADSFDIARPNSAMHLSLSTGLHRCLGASLARAEAQIAIPTVLRRLRQMELAEDLSRLRWKQSIFLRGLTSLHVAW